MMATSCNKVVLITGGGSGIGRTAAIKFAELGHKCAVADIDINAAKDTTKVLSNLEVASLALQVDVRDSESVKAMVRKTVNHFGAIHCAFNNAGVEGSKNKIADADESDFDNVVDTNLKGVWLCMKYEIQQMLKQPLVVDDVDRWKVKPERSRYTGARGVIINTSSTAGFGTMPEFSSYCASKWAVIGLTKTVAKEYAGDGIRINAICPATTDTEMRERFQNQWPEWQEQVDQSYPVGRIASPDEVVEALVWLAGEACPFITGECMKIGGGS